MFTTKLQKKYLVETKTQLETFYKFVLNQWFIYKIISKFSFHRQRKKDRLCVFFFNGFLVKFAHSWMVHLHLTGCSLWRRWAGSCQTYRTGSSLPAPTTISPRKYIIIIKRRHYKLKTVLTISMEKLRMCNYYYFFEKIFCVKQYFEI